MEVVRLLGEVEITWNDILQTNPCRPGLVYGEIIRKRNQIKVDEVLTLRMIWVIVRGFEHYSDLSFMDVALAAALGKKSSSINTTVNFTDDWPKCLDEPASRGGL